MSYVPQKSWSLSGSIQKNIEIFTNGDDENNADSISKVNESILYSNMNKDLESFSKGISTEIGDNGVNLSGG